MKPMASELNPYIRLGYELIPLNRWDVRDEHGRERGKSPRDANWRERPYAVEVVHRWLDEGGNAGVRLRGTDLVIDYDPRNAPADRNVLEELEARFGFELRGAPAVRTGSGGMHFYYVMPAGNRVVNQLPDFPGVEFKSLGRQVVAAGSVHPNGKVYLWEHGSDSALDLGAPQLPLPLLEAIQRPVPEAGAAVVATSAPASITPVELAALLEQLDVLEFREHDHWLEVMMACHAGTAGAGREEFAAWSTGDPLFADHADEIRMRWDSLEAGRAGGVTVATLYWYVLDHGGRIPHAPAAEDFEPIRDGVEGDVRPAVGPSAKLNRDREGRPLPTIRNALVAVPALGIRPTYDEMSDVVILGGDTGFLRARYPRIRMVWDDVALVAVKCILSDCFGLELSTEKIHDAVVGLAHEASFNPLTDWLDELKWDGRPRLSTWLSRFAGAEDSAYTRAVSRLLLVGAVARAYQPGIKFDTMVVLEGRQGTGKSSLLRALGGRYTLEGLPHANERDIVDAMRGYWIVEMEELAHLGRTEVNQLKAFLSRTSDRARLAYARATRDFPRRCVFVGTTNDSTYLRDPTGNRRFLPIKTGEIDLRGLAEERDQLWAEARIEWTMEPTVGALMLPTDLRGAAEEEQEDRRGSDPWEEATAHALQQYEDKLRADHVWPIRITTMNLLFEVSRKLPAEATTADSMRLATVMQRFPRWKRAKFRVGEGAPVNGYEVRQA